MSAARDREHDEWIPWYVEDTPGWLELSLAARGAMEGIARKLNRRTGKLALRRGLSSLAILLHVRWEELEPAVAELIARGKVEWDGSTFTLSDPEYVERKRRSGAERVAAHRARLKGQATNPPDVTPVTLQALPPLPVTRVTPVLVSSDLVSSGSSSLGSESTEDAKPPPWWAGACDATAMTVGGDVTGREALWARYLSSRKRKTWGMNHTDAVGWLAEVVPSDRAKARASPGAKHVQSAENRAWKMPKEMP